MELPKRQDGTTVSPWDGDADKWYNVANGVYIPTADESHKAPEIKHIPVPEPIKTGEFLPADLVMLFIKPIMHADLQRPKYP